MVSNELRGAMLCSPETERLLLRPPQDSDLDALFEIQADPTVNRFNPGATLSSREAAQQLLQSWQQHWQTEGFGYWAIALRSQPQHLLGFGGLMSKRIDGRQGLSLYFRFRPQAWGQGFASEMALAALALAFGPLRAPAVLALVQPANMPSRKTLERIGLHLKASLADVPGQAPNLLYEITAAAYAAAPKLRPEPTPFGA